jgi:hypothetical protein
LPICKGGLLRYASKFWPDFHWISVTNAGLMGGLPICSLENIFFSWGREECLWNTMCNKERNSGREDGRGVVLPECKNLVRRDLNIDLNEPLLLLLSFDIR